MRPVILFCLALGVLGAALGYRLSRGRNDTNASATPPAAATSASTFVADAGNAAATQASPAPRRHSAYGSQACVAGLFDVEGKLVAGSDAFVEQRMQWLLADYDVPEGAVVLIEPKSGALLAAAGHRQKGLNDRHIALEPRFRAASVFKMVTSSALLDRGVVPSARMCYHGGLRDVRLSELADSKQDRSCVSLSTALSHSLNVPIARWADRRLTRPALQQAARRFGFDVPPVEQGLRCWGGARIPDDRLQRARTAAGFGEVRLSAWHAAVMAAIVANRGRLPHNVQPSQANRSAQVIPRPVAESLAAMMKHTTTDGTARRMFKEGGHWTLPGFDVAGKTGSLVEGEGENWGEVTWFVGFAPVNKPRVAVAAVVVNSPYWRIRAAYVAREALRTALLRTEPYRPTQDQRRVAKKKR